MTGRHSGLGWPGALGDQARDATAPPYIGQHRRTEMWARSLRPGWSGPRRCEDCGHLEDRCECPHDCTYPEDTSD